MRAYGKSDGFALFLGKFLFNAAYWAVAQCDLLYRNIAWRLRGHAFCRMFNLRAMLFGRSVRFRYIEDLQRYEMTSDGYTRVFHAEYTNMECYLRGAAFRAETLGRVYLLDRVPFADGDLVVDCGANIGDLTLWFQEKRLAVDYLGIEPSPREHACLKDNVAPHETHNIGLWNAEGEMPFYVSSAGADSSFIEPAVYTDVVKVPVKRLDSVIDRPIKLLKVEAEGGEPEVLQGAEGILDRIAYIAADVGFERGLKEESTLAPVTNFLLARGFEVVELGSPRVVVLYRNTRLPGA